MYKHTQYDEWVFVKPVYRVWLAVELNQESKDLVARDPHVHTDLGLNFSLTLQTTLLQRERSDFVYRSSEILSSRCKVDELLDVCLCWTQRLPITPHEIQVSRGRWTLQGAGLAAAARCEIGATCAAQLVWPNAKRQRR